MVRHAFSRRGWEITTFVLQIHGKGTGKQLAKDTMEDMASHVIVKECEGDDEYNEYREVEDDNCVYNNGDVEER